MVGSTPTIIDSFLKDEFEPGKVPLLVNKDHIFLDGMNTNERGGGRQLIVPFIDKNAQGLGATRADAQTAAQTAIGGNFGGNDWNIPWGDYFASVYIGDKAMAVSASDMTSFLRDKKEEVESLYRAWGDTFEAYLLRGSGHSLGTFTISTGVCTMTNVADIKNIERGMLLQASANSGESTSDSLLGSGSIGYVYKVNYNTGVFTVATSDANAVVGTAGTPSGWTSTMHAFRASDFGGTSTPNFICDTFAAWCPAADPTETSFRGVDRRPDVVRRAGVRLVAGDVTGLGLEDRIKMLLTKMGAVGQPAKRVLIHDTQWLALANSYEARGQRAVDGKVGVGSYSSLKMATARGTVDIYGSPHMPVTACYAYDPKVIKFKSVDGFPKVLNGDGFQMIRSATADVYEFRLVSYPAYYHKEPNGAGQCPLLAP